MARYLALDWDQNQLHVVQADVKGTSVRVQKAAMWQQDGTPNPAQAEDMGKKLRELLRSAGIGAAPVLACVGRDRLIVKEIRIPPVPESEESAVVRFQAIKELTDSPEDVVLDYTINMLPSTSLSGDRKAVALVVRKELLESYQAICQAAGLKLAALTPRVVGVSACLRSVMGTTVLTPAPEPADGAVAVIVAGEKTAEVSVFRGPTFLLARSIPVTANLAGEVRRNLAVHAGQAPQHPVRAIYVAGKGASELRERLSDMTEVPVHAFDPFAGNESPDLPPAALRGCFAGPVGLLHARAAGELPINFVSPRQPRPAANPNFVRFRLAVVAVVTLLVGLFILGRVLYAFENTKLQEMEAERLGVDRQLATIKINADRFKLIDDWDNPVWLDELYDFTSHIPSVNKLRVTSVTADPLPRTTKSRYIARVTIKGKLLDRRDPLGAFNQLVEQLRKDGHYRVESPTVKGDTFTVVFNVERRAPADFKQVVKVEPPPPTPKGFGKGKGKGKGEEGGEGGAAAEGSDGSEAAPPEAADRWSGRGKGKGGKGKGGKGKGRE